MSHAIMLALMNNQHEFIDKISIYNAITDITQYMLMFLQEIKNIYEEAIQEKHYTTLLTLLVVIYLLYLNDNQQKLDTQLNNIKHKMIQQEKEFAKLNRQMKRVNNKINNYYD